MMKFIILYLKHPLVDILTSALFPKVTVKECNMFFHITLLNIFKTAQRWKHVTLSTRAAISTLKQLAGLPGAPWLHAAQNQ